jgi:glycosyltransferase involved in cell wall biosynthesis
MSRRIAIVTHTLPPSSNGQAVMLGRILRGMGPEEVAIALTRRGEADASLPAVCPLARSEPWWLIWAARLGLGVALTHEIRFRAQQIAHFAEQARAAAIVACSGEIGDWPSSLLAAQQLRLPLIAYAFDAYGQQHKSVKWRWRHREVAAKYEPAVAAAAERVIVPNEFLAEYYHCRYGARTAIVRNPIDDALLASPPPPYRAEFRRPMQIVYTGNLYVAQWDAAAKLIEACRWRGGKYAELVVYAPQSARSLASLAQRGPLRLQPPVASGEMATVHRAADVLFLPLAFESPYPEIIRTSAPGKMGEYLASGRPVLAHVPADSFVAWYFRQHACGWLVDRPDPAAILDALDEIQRDPQEAAHRVGRARQCAERDFAPAAARAAFRQAVGLDAGPSGGTAP